MLFYNVWVIIPLAVLSRLLLTDGDDTAAQIFNLGFVWFLRSEFIVIFFLSHIFLHILQVSQEQELSERRKTTVTYKKFNMQMNFRINECGVQRVNDGCVMSMSMFEFVFKLVYYIVPQSWNKLHFSRSIDTFSTAKSLIHVLFCLAFILNPIHFIFCVPCAIF